MDMLYRCGPGLDVHNKTVVAGVRRVGGTGQASPAIRTFGTMTGDLLAWSDGLVEQGVEQVAMASTGVYGKPVVNILEGRLPVLLVNAPPIKPVPGRKTDVQDGAWSAPLRPHGLLRARFVPPSPIRQLRDLTRPRAPLVAAKATAANRIQKVLEDAHSKLASVATDVLGVSGRDMLEALLAGAEDPEKRADTARRRLRNKLPARPTALRGRVTEHHRFQRRRLDHVTPWEGRSGRLGGRIEDVLVPFAAAVERLTTIPGGEQRAAATGIAAIGPTRDQFPTADQLAAWAGMGPGNNESAGKRTSDRTTKGSRWLRPMLTQAAWAASHTKETYLAAPDRRWAARRGQKRALVALGQTLRVIRYHLLTNGTTYQERGGDFLERWEPDQRTRGLVKRREKLGQNVTRQPKEDAAYPLFSG